MLLNYFVVDTEQQLRRVPRDVVEEVWSGQEDANSLGYPVDEQLRIVSVLCDDDNLEPQMCFFVRAELKHGKVTDKSRFEAYEAMTVHKGRDGECELTDRQLSGWPRDWQLQLAVALDVPAVHLRHHHDTLRALRPGHVALVQNTRPTWTKQGDDGAGR